MSYTCPCCGQIASCWDANNYKGNQGGFIPNTDTKAELVEAIAERYGELDYLRFADVLEAIEDFYEKATARG